MGLLKVAKDSVSSLLGDQWREYFYCDSITDEIIVVKGQKKVNTGRNNNTKGSDNIISNGSIIAVNEGQCMLIVDQGKVVDLCAEAGEFVYDASTEPSLLYGNLGENIKKTFSQFWRRATFGGNTAKDQRVYFFNTKEIKNNLFGTTSPVPFRVIDKNIGLDIDISVRCNGVYSFKVSNPLLFYKNVCGNVVREYSRNDIAGQMKSELLNALQPAFAKISAMGIRYSEIPAHNTEVAMALNEELTNLWLELRGIEIITLSINSVKASEEDEDMIKELQKTAVFRNAGMAAAQLSTAQAEAMKSAAKNESTGPMMAFAGMNMANMVGGMNAGRLFQMDAANNQRPAAPQSAPVSANSAPVLGWKCLCGKEDNRGKFCVNCGFPKPVNAGWTCSCGHINQGNFCPECGSKRPEGAPLYKCDKCGWEPEDPSNPPKFCPECGDPFTSEDRR